MAKSSLGFDAEAANPDLSMRQNKLLRKALGQMGVGWNAQTDIIGSTTGFPRDIIDSVLRRGIDMQRGSGDNA